MNRALILIAAFALNANAAEFEYQGKKVVSTITNKVTDCSSVSVNVVLDAFPQKYEGEGPYKIIPNGLTLLHNETDRFVSSEVYASINGQKHKIPSVSSMLKYKPELKNLFPRATTGGAQYIATPPATCTADGFSIIYWIGGNGKGSDYILRFKVSGNEISIPGVLTANELVNLNDSI